MLPMRRLTLAVLVGTMLAAAPSVSAAAERGTVRGAVTNATTGKPQPGVRVTLAAGRKDAA